MASQSFNLIDQEEEELVAFGTRQSRGPTPQSRFNSRLGEMLSQLVKVQEEAIKSQDSTAKSLEAKLSGTDDKLSHIAYKQIEQIAEMSDLVDPISTVERSLQGSPFTGSDPIRRSLTPPGHALMASVPYTLSLTTPSLVTCPGEVQNGQIVQSTTADSGPFTQKPTLRDETESKFISD